MNGNITAPIVTATYCDDIRNEVGNKTSLIGCYQSVLHPSQMPVVLPKLAIFISILLPLDFVLTDLKIVVVHDDTAIAAVDVPVTEIPYKRDPSDVTPTRRTMSSALTISPFIIEKPGLLRVSALINGEEVVGPRLLIQPAERPSEAPSRISGAPSDIVSGKRKKSAKPDAVSIKPKQSRKSIAKASKSS